MASNNANVYAAEPLSTGSALVAPLGTPQPTDAKTPLDAAFIDLGNIGEDGFTETMERTTDKKKNFGGKTVKVLQTDYVHTFKFVLLESLSADVLKAVYGADNVEITEATLTEGAQVHIHKTAKKLPKQSWVIDTTDSELDAYYRQYIAIGQIITVADVKIVHTDTIMYEVELEVFETPEGDYVQTWTDDGRPNPEALPLKNGKRTPVGAGV
jgi:hypothetical protein